MKTDKEKKVLVPAEATVEETSAECVEKRKFTGADVWQFAKSQKNSLIRYGAFVLVLIVFAITTGGKLFSAYNMKSIISQVTPLLIMSVGLIFVFAHGGMDISVGAVVGLCSLLSVYVLNDTGSLFLVLLTCIAVSVACYIINGGSSIFFKIMSTISSLAIMFAARGIVTYNVSRTEDTIRFSDSSLVKLFSDNYGFMIASCVIIVLICKVLFDYTKLGKQAKATGDNPLGAAQSGANVNLIKILCYVVAGVCVGIASVFAIARVGSVSENMGSGREMDVLIALILGGMTLSGGTRSKLSAAVIGSITYVLLSNGLSISGVPTNYISLVKGILFLLIVVLTLRQSRNIRELPR